MPTDYCRCTLYHQAGTSSDSDGSARGWWTSSASDKNGLNHGTPQCTNRLPRLCICPSVASGTLTPLSTASVYIRCRSLFMLIDLSATLRNACKSKPIRENTCSHSRNCWSALINVLSLSESYITTHFIDRVRQRTRSSGATRRSVPLKIF